MFRRQEKPIAVVTGDHIDKVDKRLSIKIAFDDAIDAMDSPFLEELRKKDCFDWAESVAYKASLGNNAELRGWVKMVRKAYLQGKQDGIEEAVEKKFIQ